MSILGIILMLNMVSIDWEKLRALGLMVFEFKKKRITILFLPRMYSLFSIRGVDLWL